MGWFWADTTATTTPVAPHPLPPANSRHANEPPPSCPMHKKAPGLASAIPTVTETPKECPYDPSKAPSSSTTSPILSKLNPLNYMPAVISNKREYTEQAVSLPMEREPSTIPRGDGEGNWEYPSPQQMYNAMLRKGYTDTPAEHVESMVSVHNFLNEGAWDEIRGWEARFQAGIVEGYRRCSHGEEGAARQIALDAIQNRGGNPPPEPRLLRFQGRPGEPTPKARMLSFMSWLYPSQFPNNPPFDRHDWFVQRETPTGEKKEVRYVIDYYSGPPEPTGEPVFYLDVRPAVDGPTSACERMLRWGCDVWWRASGGSVREELARQKARQGH